MEGFLLGCGCTCAFAELSEGGGGGEKGRKRFEKVGRTEFFIPGKIRQRNN